MQLRAQDFERTLAVATDGDFVYCDPIYRAVTRGGFDRYGPTVFTWADQQRLAKACAQASRRGATVIVSNGLQSDIVKLYPSAYLFATHHGKAIGKRSKRQSNGAELVAVFDHKTTEDDWSLFGSKL